MTGSKKVGVFLFFLPEGQGHGNQEQEDRPNRYILVG